MNYIYATYLPDVCQTIHRLNIRSARRLDERIMPHMQYHRSGSQHSFGRHRMRTSDSPRPTFRCLPAVQRSPPLPRCVRTVAMAPGARATREYCACNGGDRPAASTNDSPPATDRSIESDAARRGEGEGWELGRGDGARRGACLIRSCPRRLDGTREGAGAQARLWRKEGVDALDRAGATGIVLGPSFACA